MDIDISYANTSENLVSGGSSKVRSKSIEISEIASASDYLKRCSRPLFR